MPLGLKPEPRPDLKVKNRVKAHGLIEKQFKVATQAARPK
jgi:hypothetical protein